MDNSARGKSARRRAGVMLKVIGILIPIIILVMTAVVLFVRNMTRGIIADDSGILVEKAIIEIQDWMDNVCVKLSAERDALEFMSLPPEEAVAYLRSTADPGSAYPGGIYYATDDKRVVHASWTPGADYDPTSRDWYREGKRSAEFRFGEAYLDAITGEFVVTASSQLRDAGGRVIGVAAADVQLSEVSGIVANIRLRDTGGVFIVDEASGIVIGDGDSSSEGQNLKNFASGSLYAQIAGAVNSHDENQLSLTVDGRVFNANLSWIPNSDWVMVAYAPEDEVMSEANALTRTLILMAVVAVVALTGLIVVMLTTIVILPVRRLNRMAESIASGNLDTEIDVRSHDEFGSLARHIGKTVHRLNSYIGYINEISDVLREIARGNLTFQLELDYAGEFAKIRDALDNISDSLNETISKIDQSSLQVSAGAERLSDGSQTLSQGAAEQAAAVEKLSAAISNLSEQLHRNANEARAVSDEVNRAAERVAEGNERMRMLIHSMQDIKSTSHEIDKIIKIIEDIAFQTNILALNAAVEASRAGDAGKGFAVVAEEVRNLASKSAEAAQGSAELIRASVNAVAVGSTLADETAERLASTVSDIKSINSAVTGIYEASERQADNISQVSEGIKQISDVVRNNSATSEQTAASSQELSAQAQMLNELVERFQIKGIRSKTTEGLPKSIVLTSRYPAQ